MSTPSLVIKAGPAARRLIEREGLTPERITHLVAAAGGPKWLILDRLDRALFGDWFRGRQQPLLAAGSSIGSWRLACAAQRDPLAAIQRFEDAYLEQRYGPKPGAEEVSAEARRILDILLGSEGAQEILAHPWLRLNILAARARGWIGLKNGARQKTALAGAALSNLASRRLLGLWLERGIFHTDVPIELRADGFRSHGIVLDAANLAPALLASAAIPMVLLPVRDIAGAPAGAWLDGGMIDYHMDLPLRRPGNGAAEPLVFLPHFSATVTTGWLDKFLPWRRARNLDHTLLVAPSPEFLVTLPNGKIPDRHDFWNYSGRDDERIRDWRKAVAAGQRMADEWMELVTKGRVTERIEDF